MIVMIIVFNCLSISTHIKHMHGATIIVLVLLKPSCESLRTLGPFTFCLLNSYPRVFVSSLSPVRSDYIITYRSFGVDF